MPTIYARNKTTGKFEKVGPAANATDPTLTMAGSPADAKATGDALRSVLPTVTTSDDGKFLRVVGGVWSATTINNAEEVNF